MNRYPILAMLLIGAGAAGGLLAVVEHTPNARADTPRTSAYTPPPDSAIPKGPLGDMVREGEAIFRDPSAHAGAFVGNRLTCSDCHLDNGRASDSGPLGPAYVVYPAFRAKNGHVNTFAERLQGCFRYSMNGKAPPLGNRILVALETYAFFLAKGAPVGAELPGRGYLKLPSPRQAPDFSRGASIFANKCVSCHGSAGAGMTTGGIAYPAVFGGESYNWGAGMALMNEAAGFIKANMPLGNAGTLSDQEAWDLAAYVDGQERPQDPRFTGDVATTQKAFHDTPMSLYGRTVGGVLLGRGASPFGEHDPPAGSR